MLTSRLVRVKEEIWMPLDWGRGLRRVYVVLWVIWGLCYVPWMIDGLKPAMTYSGLERLWAILILLAMYSLVVILVPWGLLRLLTWLATGFQAPKSN